MHIQNQHGTLSYRPDIDGLRAIAVLSVILFHANIHLFQGGYLGVDIFFVISGYLISSYLLKSKIEGSFSLSNFYFRRAKRILPALFFILACSIPIAWTLLLPDQLIRFSQSLIAVLLFISNVFFWKTTNYFDIAIELKPLIHTWSLGIEEQFYLFFPMLFWVGKQLKLVQLFWICFVLLLLSLCISNYEWKHHTLANFFLLPTRSWELLAGTLLAFVQREIPFSLTISRKYHSILAFIGLSFIGLSILCFSKATPNPSFFTLLPIVGTVLTIAYAPNTIIYRLLSTRILVGIGLISYSLYLWHQPLFAFARIYYATPLSNLDYFVLILATFLLGYLTWAYIEIPFRMHYSFNQRLKQAMPCALWLVFIAIGIEGIATQGFAKRFDVPQEVVRSFALPERGQSCFDLTQGHTRKKWRCPVDRKAPQGRYNFFLTGDSHALQLLSVFEQGAQLVGKNGTFAGFSGCVPFLGVYPLMRDDQASKDCALLNKRIFDYIKKNQIKNIILVARWTYYTDGGYNSEPKLINYIGTKKSIHPSIETSRSAFEQGLAQTIQAYKDLGVHIYIVSQVPAQRQEPQAIYYKAFQSVQVTKSLDEASIPLSEHLRLQSFVASIFLKYQHDPFVTFINMDSALCTQTICPIGNKSGSYYQDNNHLSALGASRLLQKVVDTLKFIT